MNTEKLKLFLYILLRDEVCFGVIERIIEQHVEKSVRHGGVNFSEDDIEKYVDSVIERLK